MRRRRYRRPDGRARRPAGAGGRLARRAEALLAPLRCALALVVALLAPERAVRAQGDVATEGALFLLLPVGGRAVGMGQAVVAGVDGSEAVWWNPAGLARQEKRELAIHHSEPFVETSGDALSLVIPSSLLGVLAISANLIDYGTEDQTDQNGNVIGSITTRSFVFAGSYATAVGDRLNAGITYKVLQFAISCSIQCPPGIGAKATSSAIDLGAQYDLRGLLPVTLGVAVRNIGPSLQVNDNPQRDKLPLRMQVGARWRVGALERRTRDTEIAIAGDVLDRVSNRAATYRAGADATWRKQVSFRAGYVFDGPDASGPTIGIGLRRGGLVVDIGRQWNELLANAEIDPFHLSLRYQF